MPADPSPSGTLHIRLLGHFSLTRDGLPLPGFEQPRLRLLLAYLLLHRHTPISRQQLAFTFWPDTPDAQALKNLRTLLTRLRQALPAADTYLQSTPSTIQWRQDTPCDLDVANFESFLHRGHAAASQGTPAALLVETQNLASLRIAALQAAVDLYTGDLLPGIYDEWLLADRERLRQAYLDALERLATLLAGQHRYKDALRYAQRLVRVDPLHETVYRQLMQLHLALGDRASALRVYHTCATILRHELGVEPGTATQEIYQRVLVSDAVSAGLPATPMPQAPTASDFVGRQAEWEALLSVWRQAAAGQAQVALINGEAGIGKTRLAEELQAWLERQGIATAVAHCYPSGDSLAYAPVAEWLRSDALRPRWRSLDTVWLGELSRLLPELPASHPGLPPPGPMTEAWQRQRFFQALTRAVMGQPLLLFLDDVQWCDQETLAWLHYLLQGAATAPLLLVGTVRMEEAGEDHPLAMFRRVLERHGRWHALNLSPLSAAETASLAAGLLGHPLTPVRAAQLYGDTEGNPLFVVETLRAELQGQEASGPADGNIHEDGPREAGPTSAPGLPSKVSAVIQRRLSLLSPPARALAETAAVIGREFAFDVLARASGQDEAAVVQGLDELWRRQLVREQAGTDAYDFSHDKIRVVAYGGISPVRRRALHLQAAEALEALRTDDLDAHSAQIAGHFEQAGRPQPAVAYYRRAAAAAQRIYANAEAIRHYQHLLYGELSRNLSVAETCAVMLALGEVWRLTGQWAEAVAINREAEAAAATLGDVPLQAQAQRALADVLRLQGHYDSALEWLARAELGYESIGDWRGVVSALWTMGEIYWFKGDNPRALVALERQLGIATEIDDQRGVCEALDTMGMVYWSQGDWDRSVDCCQRSIAIAEPLGYHLVITRAAITLGNVYSSQYATAEAVRWYLRAGLLARQIDDRQVLSWAIANTAHQLQNRGDYPRALAGYEQAVRIALEIGDRWTACLIVSSLGDIARRQNRLEQAELLYRKAAGYGRRLGIPSYLSGTLVDLARLLLEQGRAEEARPIYAEAVELIGSVAGEYLAGEDTRFRAQVLGIRLRHAPPIETQDLASLRSAALAKAVGEIRTLLHQASTPAHQAALWYELWHIAPDDEETRTSAATLYRSLFAETDLHDYRQRYQQLTGETLPDPPPLPDVSELIPFEPVDLDALVPRLEPLLAQLDASFD